MSELWVTLRIEDLNATALGSVEPVVLVRLHLGRLSWLYPLMYSEYHSEMFDIFEIFGESGIG